MGKLYIVATPIGNLDDMSQRAIETLKSVDLIAAEDTRHTNKLLNHFNIKCKMVSYHKFNEKERTVNIIDKILMDNIDVALVSDAGTPCISDPGYELVKNARENGIQVIGISGPSAVVTALSISGFDTKSFSFYGFLPREKFKRHNIYMDIRKSEIDTFVLYESPKRVLKLANEIMTFFPDAKVCFCCDLSKFYEKTFHGKIRNVIEMLSKDEKVELGEYTVVIQKNNDIADSSDKENKMNKSAETTDISLEAVLIDEMIREKCSLKTALEKVHGNFHSVSKKDIYKASLNLKNLAKELTQK